MQFKDILVFLDDGASNAQRMDLGFRLAKTHDARLTGVTLSNLIPSHLKVTKSKTEAWFSDQAAEQRVERFRELAETEGLLFSSCILKGDKQTVVDRFAQLTRSYDLLVMRQSNPRDRNYAIIDELSQKVLTGSGRPVIFMPYIGVHRMPCEIGMIAWDGTPAASRAVHDALPLIKTLHEVIILQVRRTKENQSIDDHHAEELARHLQRHGANVRIKRLYSGSFDIPTVILNEVADNSIDLLVMGGFGRPGLKQKLFGVRSNKGITRTLLTSMITPVLMSH